MLRRHVTNRPTHYKSKYKFELSPRERDVLALVTRGHTNGEIATSLGLAFDTVKWHVSGVLGKLGVDSREEAAAYWRSYNSLGGRLGRGWSAVLGLLTTKAAAIAGASAAVVAVAAAAAIALVLSLSANDSNDSINPPPTLPEARVGTPARLPAGANVPLVQSGGSIFIPTTQGLAYFDAATRATHLVAGTTPGPLAASPAGQVWTKGAQPSSLVQVDPSTRSITRTVELPFRIDDTTFIYAGDTALYVSFWSFDALVRVSLVSGAVDSTITLNRPKGATLAAGYLWVALVRSDAVAKLNPDTLEVVAEIPLGTAKDNPICGGCVQWVYPARDSIYAISTQPGQVTRIDIASSMVVGTVLLPGKLLPGFAAASDGDAWVPVTAPGTLHGDVVRIDYETLSEVERIGLGPQRASVDPISPIGLIELNGTLWVATEQGEFIPVRIQA